MAKGEEFDDVEFELEKAKSRLAIDKLEKHGAEVFDTMKRLHTNLLLDTRAYYEACLSLKFSEAQSFELTKMYVGGKR
jgi:hypothetical protein